MFVVVFLAVSAVAHSQPAGPWFGHVTADKAALIANTKSPHDKKLLTDSLRRMKTAIVLLQLGQEGTFTWSFSDGYLPDAIKASGTWRHVNNTLFITTLKMNGAEVRYPKREAWKLAASGEAISKFPLKGFPKGFYVSYVWKGRRLGAIGDSKF